VSPVSTAIVIPAVCRWCGPSDECSDARCVWEERAALFYNNYFKLLGRPDITWDFFPLGDRKLFATAMRQAFE